MTVLRRIPPDWRLFLPAWAALVVAKFCAATHRLGLGADGGYYTDVARNVRDGLGFVSNVSVFHFGYPYFPHPTRVYPVWPLLLGLLGRIVDLESLVRWLPPTLYATALVAMFLAGRRFLPRPVLPEIVPGLHGGHLLALGIGLHQDFLVYTGLPVTEGLAWTLFGLLLWRLPALGTGALGALELGAWLALGFLVRSQFVLLPMAAAVAYAVRIATGPGRARSAGNAIVALAVPAAAICGTLIWIRQTVPGAGLSAILRFDVQRVNAVLEPWPTLVNDDGWVDLVLDRLNGVLLAFDAAVGDSYGSAYWSLQWALPLALPFVAADAWRARGRLLEWLRGNGSWEWVFLGALAAGGLLSIHVAHKEEGWWFGRRQALVCLPALWLCLVVLLRRRGLPGVLGIAVLCGTSWAGGVEAFRQADEGVETHLGRWQARETRLLGRWLNERVDADGPIAVAMERRFPQMTVWRTHDVGYHWFGEHTSYADLLKMCDVLGARFVVYHPFNVGEWRFLKEADGRIETDFEVEPDPPAGFTILRRVRR